MLPAYQDYCQGNTAVLPEGFTVIEKDAFSDNLDLVRVVIPSTVTAIEDGAFRGCSNLKEVSIPESVLEIGNSAFCNCEKLSAIQLPKNLRYLGQFAFANSGLKRVTLEMQDEDFQMERGAFRDCPSLTEVTIKCKYLGEHAFINCENLERISFGEGLRGIGDYAFADCPKISSIKLQGKWRHIGRSAFANSGLKSVTLASQDEEFYMGQGVFKDCSALALVNIDSKYIGQDAFMGCTHLQKVFVWPTTPPRGSQGMFDDTKSFILVPEESVEAYQEAEYWREYAERIKAMPDPRLD